MSRRLIINNRDGIDEQVVLAMVARVIEGGNVSETAGVAHPCAITLWKSGELVECHPTRSGSLTFNVYRDQGNR